MELPPELFCVPVTSGLRLRACCLSTVSDCARGCSDTIWTGLCFTHKEMVNRYLLGEKSFPRSGFPYCHPLKWLFSWSASWSRGDFCALGSVCDPKWEKLTCKLEACLESHIIKGSFALLWTLLLFSLTHSSLNSTLTNLDIKETTGKYPRVLQLLTLSVQTPSSSLPLLSKLVIVPGAPTLLFLTALQLNSLTLLKSCWGILNKK